MPKHKNDSYTPATQKALIITRFHSASITSKANLAAVEMLVSSLFRGIKHQLESHTVAISYDKTITDNLKIKQTEKPLGRQKAPKETYTAPERRLPKIQLMYSAFNSN